MGDMVEWFHFFNHAHEEVKKAMRTHYKNPAIHNAFSLLEEMSADEKTRYLAEIREKSLKNKNSELGSARSEGRREGRTEGRKEGRTEGRREGRTEGKKDVAMNMISLGSFSTEQISQVTRLHLDEVRRLQDSRQAEAH